MLNIYLIIVLFGTAAIIGVTLLLKVVKNEATSKPAVFAHGGLAALGLVLLFIYYLNSPAGLLVPLVLFVLAAFGGFVLFFKDWTKQVIPNSVAFIHAGVAVAGFILLLLAVL